MSSKSRPGEGGGGCVLICCLPGSFDHRPRIPLETDQKTKASPQKRKKKTKRERKKKQGLSNSVRQIVTGRLHQKENQCQVLAGAFTFPTGLGVYSHYSRKPPQKTVFLPKRFLDYRMATKHIQLGTRHILSGQEWDLDSTAIATTSRHHRERAIPARLGRVGKQRDEIRTWFEEMRYLRDNTISSPPEFTIQEQKKSPPLQAPLFFCSIRPTSFFKIYTR